MCERIIVVCILLFLGDLARAHFMVPSKTIQIGPKENQKTPAWATSLWREGNRWFGNAQKNPAEQGKLAEADEEPEPIHSQLERIEMQRTIYTKITNNHVPVPRPNPALINFGAKKHLKETDVPVEAKLATDTISHSSEGLANEEQIHSGLTHNPMDHVGGHMSTERDVALTSEPSPSNVQEKGNSGKSNNQEWRIYDDPDLINFGAKKHLKETDVPVEAKLATDISFSAANIEPFSNELALALSSLLDEYSDTAEYSESQSSV